jgi:RNA polymerase sigma-70 factor (ECF subfamily)
MERVQRGEVRAFEALFERYRRRLFGFLARRCRDDAIAEDLLQETWLRVVRASDRYDPQRRFSTWLFQIANNLCRDRARRLEVETRGKRALSDVQRVEQQGRRGDASQRRLDLMEQLDSLSEAQREVLWLRYYQDLPERDIAEIVGIPRGTVKSRLHQAIRVLRAQASEAEEGDEP